MTKGEAIDKLKRWRRDVDDEKEYPEYLEGWFYKDDEIAFDMAIEALKEQKTGKWIPVSERLPEEKGMYLVTVQDYVLMEQWSGTGWWATRPTAWMPLPTPFLEPTCEQKGED